MLAILFLVSAAGQDLLAQETISGVVNKYGRINTIWNHNPNDGQDSVIVYGAGAIWDGSDNFELALFMQMKGTSVHNRDHPIPNFWGTVKNLFNTGIYSFMLVDRVVNDSIVIFSSTLREDLILPDPQDDTIPLTAQLIKVPYGNSFLLDGDLKADPWDPDKGTGGVLAIFAAKKLDLDQYSIDVTSQGFLGGDTLRVIQGITDCGNQDNSFRLDSEVNIAGKKGGGIVYDGYEFVRGNAFVLGGGGGGEGRWSGGAGGSNANRGGRGGDETDLCSLPQYFGRGEGIGITYFTNGYNRLYLGSGGGSSVPEPNLTATPGGNGGGIVIIITDTLAAGSSGANILASGQSITDTSFTGGSGGGAGGFIVLDVNNVIGNINIDVSGGRGGNTYDPTPLQFHGPGGGGSGGVIWHNDTVLLPGLLEIKSGGERGEHLPFGGSENAGPGNEGITLSDLVLPLRGFFFNFISGDQDVCQDTVPETIIGSQPKGDVLFTYEWQDSTMGFLPAAVGGATSKNYSPLVLTESTWYRRIVTKTTAPIESDTSNWIEKTVFDRIQNNLIAPDDTVCFGQKPAPMSHFGTALSGGNGLYNYQWWIRTDNDPAWKKAGSVADDGIDSTAGFISGPLTDTTYFSRQVISHVCHHISDSLAVVVLPVIDNNIIDGNDTVCQYSDAGTITGLVPTGGDIGNYTYRWQAKSDISAWNPVGTGTVNYSPGSMDTVTTYYRRWVVSGKEERCSDMSNEIIIQVDPEILQNNIAPDTAICAETSTNLIYPDALITGGDGIYNYTFHESTDSSLWSIARTESIVSTYDPVELAQTTWFYRSVVSGTCFDTSNAIRFYVDPVITSNNLLTADDTICQGTDSQGILGSEAGGGDKTPPTYLWDKSTNQTTWTEGFSSGRDLGAQLIYDTTWYRRRVLSGVCFDTSSIVVVNIHDTIVGNLIWADTVLADDNCVLLPKLIQGQDENDGLIGGTGDPADFVYFWQKSDPPGDWNAAPAGGDLSNDQNNYETEVLTAAEYTYRRYIVSGKCSHISDSVTLIVKPRPMGSITPTATDSSCFDGANQIRIVIPVTFTEGLQPFTLYYNDGVGGTGTEILDTYSGDFSVFRATSDSTLYTVMIDSIVDAYGCVDTMQLANKGLKQAILYSDQSPSILQDTFRVCGPEATIAVNEGIGLNRYWGPAHSEYTFTPDNLPQSVFSLTGWSNDTLFYPVTWYQQNGVCDQHSVTITVELYQQPDPATLKGRPDSLVYFRQFMPLWADTVEIGLGTWDWVDDPEWKVSDGGDPVKEIHNNSSEIDLGGENMDKEVRRDLSWWVRNGECPVDTINVRIIRRDIVRYSAFSPNGDMYNEYLILDGLEWADEFIMQIFSRHMVLVKTVTESDVFVDPRTGDMNAIWDGRMQDGSEAADGTYFYMIEVMHAGQKYNYKNYLELIRTEVQ